MTTIPTRIAFMRGVYDASNEMPHPSVDLGGDPDKWAAWEAGQAHFKKMKDEFEKKVADENARLEAALATGEGFPTW